MRPIATLLVALATACPALAAAQGAGVGATTLLRIAPGPRPLALGHAYAAVRDPVAIEYNPAGMDGAGIAAAYQRLPADVMAGAAVVAGRVGGLTLAGSLRYLDYGAVEVIEPTGGPVGERTGATASGGEISALLGAAGTLGRVRVGLAARWLRQEVAGLSDGTVAVDAGLLVEVAPWLDAGASVQHVGPELEAGRAAPLPRTVRIGAAARGPVAGLELLVTGEVREREDRRGAGVGLEVTRGWEDGAATLRLGVETRPVPGDAFSPLVVGGAVRLGRVAVELAWRAMGPLGSTRQLGLRYRF